MATLTPAPGKEPKEVTIRFGADAQANLQDKGQDVPAEAKTTTPPLNQLKKMKLVLQQPPTVRGDPDWVIPDTYRGRDEPDEKVTNAQGRILEGRQHQCNHCKRFYYKSGLVFMNPGGHDWQGENYMECAECCGKSYATFEQFKTKVTASWRYKEDVAQEDMALVRSSGYKAAAENVDRRFDTETRRAYRHRVKCVQYRFAAQIMAAFQKATPENRQKMVQAVDDWAKTAMRQTLDPQWVPELGAGVGLADQVVDVLDKIGEGLNEYYLDRKKICGCIAPSAQWPYAKKYEESHGHFRCPMCATFYQPWAKADKEAYTAAQKVLILETGTEDSVGKRNVDVMLCEWPDTKTQTLTQRFKEIAAELEAEFGNLSLGEQIEYIQHKVSEARRTFFTWTPFAKETKDWLEDINHSQGPEKAKWRYDNCEMGYFALRYKFAVPEAGESPDVILDTTDVIRTWGLAAYQMSQYRRLSGRTSSSSGGY